MKTGKIILRVGFFKIVGSIAIRKTVAKVVMQLDIIINTELGSSQWEIKDK
jgi:hypothetical protein